MFKVLSALFINSSFYTCTEIYEEYLNNIFYIVARTHLTSKTIFWLRYIVVWNHQNDPLVCNNFPGLVWQKIQESLTQDYVFSLKRVRSWICMYQWQHWLGLARFILPWVGPGLSRSIVCLLKMSTKLNIITPKVQVNLLMYIINL